MSSYHFSAVSVILQAIETTYMKLASMWSNSAYDKFCPLICSDFPKLKLWLLRCILIIAETIAFYAATMTSATPDALVSMIVDGFVFIILLNFILFYLEISILTERKQSL
jgi:hypothetical protein